MKHYLSIGLYASAIIGYCSLVVIIMAISITAPFTLAGKVALFTSSALALTLISYFAYFSDHRVNRTLKSLLSSTYVAMTLFTFVVGAFTLTNYRFGFMMRLTGSLLNNSLRKKHNDAAPVSSLKLLSTYTKFMARFATTHDYPATPHTDRLFGYTVNSYSYYDLNSLVHEIFSQGIYKFTANTKKPFIIDCGSNIGISILYFKKLYPQAKIIGFEPDKTTYKTLTANIMNNNLENVQLHNKALHPNKEKLIFYTRENTPGYPGQNAYGMFDCATKKEIAATKLSPYVTQSVDFLKLDIEGAEAAMLQELADANKLHMVKQMVLEFHPDKNSLAGTLSLLEKHNFKYIVSNGAKTPFAKKDAADLQMIYAYNTNH